MRYSLPRSFLISFEHRAPFVTLRVPPPSRREAIIQKSREKSRLFVQSINASHELFKFSERGSVRLLFCCFSRAGQRVFPQLKCGFSFASCPFFIHAPRCGAYTGDRHMPCDPIVVWRSPSVSELFPVCLNYTSGAGFVLLNFFAVSM